MSNLDTAKAALVDALHAQYALNSAVNAAADALSQVVLLDPWMLVDQTGMTDVTDAIQRAFDAGLTVPAGRYLVAPNKLTVTRDVTLAADAVLVLIPNGLTRYAVVTVAADDVSFTGGRITGDRLAHDYTAIGTHEWGYGLKLSGDRIKVNGTVCELCTGDGIAGSGLNIEIRNVVCTKNRRNGASFFNASGLRVYGSEFSYTGAAGTNPGAANGPWAGVDIEPDAGGADDIVFDTCRFIRNGSAGFLMWTRAGTGATVTHVVLSNSTLDSNANGVETKGLGGAVTLSAIRNTLLRHKGAAFKVGAGSVASIGSESQDDANIITGMATRTASLQQGIVTRYDIQVSSGGSANVGWNQYR